MRVLIIVLTVGIALLMDGLTEVNSQQTIQQFHQVIARKKTGVAYVCDGAVDWGGGDVIESFERSAGNFCCADWTEDDGTNKVSTYDSAQAKHLSYSASIIHNVGTATNEYLQGALNSVASSRWFGGWFYAPDLDTNENFDEFIVIKDSADNQTVITVTLDDDADVQKLCFGDDCTTDYFTLTAGAWWYIAIQAVKNDTSSLKVYNSASVQQNCTGSGSCSTNVMTATAANEDIGWIRLVDQSTDADDKISYWDGWENSASELSP